MKKFIAIFVAIFFVLSIVGIGFAQSQQAIDKANDNAKFKRGDADPTKPNVDKNKVDKGKADKGKEDKKDKPKDEKAKGEKDKSKDKDLEDDDIVKGGKGKGKKK